jgi:hypothetical protein
MFDSPESASLWFDIFNGVLFTGALLVTIGTWGTIKTAGIKERLSDERIAANEAETKRAIADSDSAKEGAARAHERIAELTTQGDVARKETAQAKLLLEQMRFPRSFDFEKFKAAIAKVPPVPVEVLFDANAPDAPGLATQIWISLFQSKWPMVQLSGPTPVGPPDPNNLMATRGTWVQGAGGGPWGLSVVIAKQPDFDKDPIGSALVRALGECVAGPPTMTTFGRAYGDLPADRYRIIVGPKLP